MMTRVILPLLQNQALAAHDFGGPPVGRTNALTFSEHPLDKKAYLHEEYNNYYSSLL